MDVNAITTFIGSFGFPIVACIAMAWYVNNTHKELINCMYAINRTLKVIITKLDIEEEEDKL